mmetsp:Transcript_72988/g.171581  ORF Transcript_72988/g.171581 Transcript_72988/m.171581 type:complete len:905 (-) Transcript_72988:106-2820(-)
MANFGALLMATQDFTQACNRNLHELKRKLSDPEMFGEVRTGLLDAELWSKTRGLKSVEVWTSASSWLRDLTTEGVEPNPGPALLVWLSGPRVCTKEALRWLIKEVPRRQVQKSIAPELVATANALIRRPTSRLPWVCFGHGTPHRGMVSAADEGDDGALDHGVKNAPVDLQWENCSVQELKQFLMDRHIPLAEDGQRRFLARQPESSRPPDSYAPPDGSLPPVFGRVQLAVEAMQHWYDRTHMVNLGKLSSSPHLVVAASHGLGKSTFLDVLASSESSTREWKVKSEALELFSQKGPKQKQFSEHLRNAVGVTASFGHMSPRSADRKLQDETPTKALAVRMLWSHFTHFSFSYSDFLDKLPASLPSINDSMRLIKEDTQEAVGANHVILCVDELKVVANSEYSWKQSEVQEFFSHLAALLVSSPTTHIILSSLQLGFVRSYVSRTGRRVHALNLSRLQDKDVEKFLEQRPNNWWWTSKDAVHGRSGAQNRQLSKQIIDDCGGVPRLLQRVTNHFDHRECCWNLDQIQFDLWRARLAPEMETMIGGAKYRGYDFKRLMTRAMNRLFSGQTYHFRVLDELCQHGLLVQNLDDRVDQRAYLPPLLLGVMYYGLQSDPFIFEDLKKSESDAFRLLDAGHRFLGLDTLKDRAATAGSYFEQQVAQLVRIRLLLHPYNRHLFSELFPCLSPTTRWWVKDGQPNTSEALLLYKDSNNKLCDDICFASEQEIKNMARSPTGQTRILVVKRENYPAVDLFIQFPKGELVALQVRFAAVDTQKTKFSNGKMTKIITSFSLCDTEVATRTVAIGVLAYRSGTKSLNSNVFMPTTEQLSRMPNLQQVGVLVKDDMDAMMPLIFTSRPEFQRAWATPKTGAPKGKTKGEAKTKAKGKPKPRPKPKWQPKTKGDEGQE